MREHANDRTSGALPLAPAVDHPRHRSVGLTVRAGDAVSTTGDDVVFILTDDEAAHERSASRTCPTALLPLARKPLSGQCVHSHQVRGDPGPYGGWERFRPKEPDSLPTWTQNGGYCNGHIGKYMNGYAAGPSTPLPVPPGWDEWYGKVSETNLYFNHQLIEKTGPGDTPEIGFYGDQLSDLHRDPSEWISPRMDSRVYRG